MMDGFDLDSPLVCEGIVGDGCGGGRLFFIEDGVLQAYDPISKTRTTLYKSIENAKKISKSACIITVECERDDINFDLSIMKII